MSISLISRGWYIISRGVGKMAKGEGEGKCNRFVASGREEGGWNKVQKYGSDPAADSAFQTSLR